MTNLPSLTFPFLSYVTASWVLENKEVFSKGSPAIRWWYSFQ